MPFTSFAILRPKSTFWTGFWRAEAPRHGAEGGPGSGRRVARGSPCGARTPRAVTGPPPGASTCPENPRIAGFARDFEAVGESVSAVQVKCHARAKAMQAAERGRSGHPHAAD